MFLTSLLPYPFPAILLITDGVATRPTNTATAQAAALSAAAAINATGTFLRPVFYNPYATADDLDFVTSLSSDGVVSEADIAIENFDQLIGELIPPTMCG